MALVGELITGTRVFIRDFLETDISDDYISWLNDPVVVRFSSQRFIHHDQESSRRYLLSFATSDSYFFLVQRIDTREAIGTLTVYIEKHHGTADVGILIGDRSIWGCGYGQDAWNTVLGWLQEEPGIRKITAGTLSSNCGMIKLMERSGMKQEAIRRDQEVLGGSLEDVLLYAIFV